MWKKVLFALSILLGLAGFAAIPFIVGVEDMLGTIQRTGVVCLSVFTLVAGVTIVVPAIAWWIIMKGEGIPASPWHAIKANFMGFPINMMAPSAYLGAEPLKTVYVAKACDVTKRRVLATIIVAKVQEVASLAFVMLLSSIIYMWRVDLGPGQEIGVGIVTGLMVVGMTLIMIGFFRNAQPTVKIINALAGMGIARRRMARLRSKAEEMENMIHAAFTHRWKRFIVAQLVTLVSATSIFFRPFVYFIFDSRIGALPVDHLSAIYVVTNLINTFSFTPGGIGVFEAALAGYFNTAGLGGHNGAAYALANRIFDVVYIVIGVWLIVHTGLTGVAKGIAKGKDQSIKPEDLPTPADL